VSTSFNREIEIDVLDNDSDADNDLNIDSLRITANPDDGTARVNDRDGTITYTPDDGFSGTDRFVYEICDDTDRCDPGTVTVTVSSSVNDDSGSDEGSRVTLRTLLPVAEDCSFSEQASIDVVPGNDENIIRLDDGRGFTPVAILSSELFPAANCVDVSTIEFGVAGDEIAPVSCGAVSTRNNEFVDVVCDFKTSDLNFTVEDTRGSLTASVIDGSLINTTDVVEVVEARRLRSRIIETDHTAEKIRTLQIARSLIFSSAGGNVARMEIEVFSLRGDRVYQAKKVGQVLRWNMRGANNQTLANGTYLYLIKQYDIAGNVVGYSIGKVAVLR